MKKSVSCCENVQSNNLIAIFAFLFSRLLGGEVKEDKGKKAYKPPKYKLVELLKAVKNCNMTIIKEFIDEIYSKRNEKVHHCVEMWKVSQKENQKEVEKKLAQHYQDLIEDTSEHKLTGSAESQVKIKLLWHKLINNMIFLVYDK